MAHHLPAVGVRGDSVDALAPEVRGIVELLDLRWAFNVRCIDAIDLSSIKVRPFDGQNWEATAKAYHDRLKKPPAA